MPSASSLTGFSVRLSKNTGFLHEQDVDHIGDSVLSRVVLGRSSADIDDGFRAVFHRDAKRFLQRALFQHSASRSRASVRLRNEILFWASAKASQSELPRG